MNLPREGSRDTSQGIIISLTPDVCLTPVGSATVPVPYSVYAIQDEDANTAATVHYTGQRAHNMASLTTCCHGDEPGTALGVVSGTVGGVCNPKTHSASVRVQGKWAIRHTDEWWMNNRNTVGKLYWVKTNETPGPTPAITLAQNPEMEAPEPILLADAGPNRVNFVFPEGTPAPPAAEPKPFPPRPPAPRPPPPRPIPTPNRVARPPSFKPTPPPGFKLNVTGALVHVRKLTPWALAAGAFLYQNTDSLFYDQVRVGDIELFDLDPVEQGLLDLAKEAYANGGERQEIEDWFQSEVERYRKEKREAEAIAPPEAGRTTETVTVTEDKKRQRCKTKLICFMPKSEKVDMAEFRRQLKLQEAALNRMAPGTMLANRAAYLANPAGMRALSEPLQRQTRDQYRASITSSYRVRYGGNAKAMLDAHMETVAALHNSDMIAGGRYDTVADRSLPLRDRIGGINENSSMGSQWQKGRAARLETHAREQLANGCPSVQVILEVCESGPS